ncbi:MAG: S-layer homology domain-containing protein [Clostridia bacterium]|nr:S-layer homology domain-containing protein [Clostridia bacterium]
MKRILAFLLIGVMIFLLSTTALANSVKIDTDIPMIDVTELTKDLKKDQKFTLADPAPWNLDELKQVVNVKDPRSVAAYFVWAVTRLVDNYDDGMEMMKYLFADIEPYGSGFTEGGMSGRAGWDTYMNERLKSTDYKWLPRAYFDGASGDNGFQPTRPLTLELYYNNTNTETINAQTFEQHGRLNIVYWVKSYAAGNQVNITVSRFDGSDRWYVTSGTTSAALFYDQRGGINNTAKNLLKTAPNDTSTQAEHRARYGGTEPLPFTDVKDTDFFANAVAWAYTNNVTTGTSETTFGPLDSCTRGQVATFLWRAAGNPEPTSTNNPFTDVNSNDYFYKPVLWAVEKGITAGTSADRFSPNETCSSAHIITFLYRAAGIGENGWYEEAKGWAKGAGMLEGTNIVVSPDESCPRGAVVTFLEKIYNK